MKTRPVRLAPWAAGARPTTTRRAAGSPNPATGRPQYVLAGERRPAGAAATASRQATSRGQRPARRRSRRSRAPQVDAGAGRHVAARRDGRGAGPATPKPTDGTPCPPRRRPPPRPSSCWSATAGPRPPGPGPPGPGPGPPPGRRGPAQAERVAERIAALATAGGRLRLPPRTDQGDGGPDRPGARAAGPHRPGLIECDMGAWTGGRLKRLAKTPRMARGAALAGRVPVPRRRVVRRAVDPGHRGGAGLVAAHPGETVVAVSHADPIKAVGRRGGRRPPRPLPALVVSPCSVSAIVYGAAGPPRPVRQLDGVARRPGPVVTEPGDPVGLSDDRPAAPDRFSVGTEGPVGRAGVPPPCAPGADPPSPSRSRSNRWPSWPATSPGIVRELGRPGHAPRGPRLRRPRSSPTGPWAPSGSPTTTSTDRLVVVVEEVGGRRRGRRRQRPRLNAGGGPHPRHPGAGGGLRHPGHPAGGGRPAAVPPVRPAARPLGPRLPADQRPPPPGHVTYRRPRPTAVREPAPTDPRWPRSCGAGR